MSVGAVWVAALAGIFVIAFGAAPERHVTWVSTLMLILICLTCVIQLALQESDGFVRRMCESLVGALVILALGSAVLALLGGGALVGVNVGAQ
ncbi:hypothetical protein GCM10011490_11790 [Pseudoclavibacter endophyticus]|nr:hypothetical protein GCM10011490_11790 [Pseudoclavibacter endophyticus]